MTSSTVLGDFQRSIRDEPFFYIYKRKIWVQKDTVPEIEVVAWLRDRYVDKRSGHRYRVVTYRTKKSDRFVDYILMETCTEGDLLYMMLRWGWSESRVARGNRHARKRLTRDQKERLDTLIQQTKDAFLDSL